MSIKSFLKSFKLNESTISMVLGTVVIVVVGVLVVNYFRDIESPTDIPVSISDESQNGSLPTTHIVQGGEDLWKISEKYYNTGYNWVDIAEANEISSPGTIEIGQELAIPNVASKTIGDEIVDDVAQTSTEILEPEITEEPIVGVEDVPEMVNESADNDVIVSETTITGESYTVQTGDSLWEIATRAYGDGNQWTKIAEANNLVNPNLIHSGNVFVLPAIN